MNDRDDDVVVTRVAQQATPAADLGELWQVLDTLPRAEPPEALLATTIEMVAVKGTAAGAGQRSGREHRRLTALRHDLWQWLTPAAVVLAAIGAGFWLGQATAVGPGGDAERAEWWARREAAIRQTLKNDPEARRLLREKLREAEAAGPLARPPASRQLRPGGQERPAPPRKRFPGPRGEPGGQPPAPPAAGPAAAVFPSPASPLAA